MALAERGAHMHLNFSEASILMVLHVHKDRTKIMNTLSELSENTTDPILLRELEGLTEKLVCLTDEEFTALLRDAEQGTIVFPANYELPHL